MPLRLFAIILFATSVFESSRLYAHNSPTDSSESAGCETQVTSEAEALKAATDAAILSLLDGQKLYGEPDQEIALDEQTIADLRLKEAEEILVPHLFTDVGRMRWRHILRHPLYDPESIRRRQVFVAHLADNPETLAHLRAHLAAVRDEGYRYIESLKKIEGASEEGMRADLVRASVNIGLRFVPLVGKLFGAFGSAVASVAASQVQGGATANLMDHARPRRHAFSPFRAQMLSSRRALEGLGLMRETSPIAQELYEAVSTVHRGARPSQLSRMAIRLNAKHNPTDRDLLDHIRELKDRDDQEPSSSNCEPGREEGLADLYRNLILMEVCWTKTFAGRQFSFRPDRTMDLFHLSNFPLNKMQTMVVKSKSQIARLYSALGDLEVHMAMAEFYRQHRRHVRFLTVLDHDRPAYISMTKAHHPLFALDEFAHSVPNDVFLGHLQNGEGNSFGVALGAKQEGASSFLEMVGLNTVLTQIGMPVFAEGGELTPLHGIVTAKDLHHSLTGGISYFQAEARRWAQIERLHEISPYFLTLFDEPFSGAGDLRSLALRAEIVRSMIRSPIIGVMTTKSRDFIRLIAHWRDLSILKVENKRVTLLDPDSPNPVLDPEVTFNGLLAEGVSPEFVEHAQAAHRRLRAIRDEALEGRHGAELSEIFSDVQE